MCGDGPKAHLLHSADLPGRRCCSTLGTVIGEPPLPHIVQRLLQRLPCIQPDTTRIHC